MFKKSSATTAEETNRAVFSFLKDAISADGSISVEALYKEIGKTQSISDRLMHAVSTRSSRDEQKKVLQTLLVSAHEGRLSPLTVIAGLTDILNRINIDRGKTDSRLAKAINKVTQETFRNLSKASNLTASTDINLHINLYKAFIKARLAEDKSQLSSLAGNKFAQEILESVEAKVELNSTQAMARMEITGAQKRIVTTLKQGDSRLAVTEKIAELISMEQNNIPDAVVDLFMRLPKVGEKAAENVDSVVKRLIGGLLVLREQQFGEVSKAQEALESMLAISVLNEHQQNACREEYSKASGLHAPISRPIAQPSVKVNGRPSSNASTASMSDTSTGSLTRSNSSSSSNLSQTPITPTITMPPALLPKLTAVAAKPASPPPVAKPKSEFETLVDEIQKSIVSKENMDYLARDDSGRSWMEWLQDKNRFNNDTFIENVHLFIQDAKQFALVTTLFEKKNSNEIARIRQAIIAGYKEGIRLEEQALAASKKGPATTPRPPIPTQKPAVATNPMVELLTQLKQSASSNDTGDFNDSWIVNLKAAKTMDIDIELRKLGNTSLNKILDQETTGQPELTKIREAILQGHEERIARQEKSMPSVPPVAASRPQTTPVAPPKPVRPAVTAPKPVLRQQQGALIFSPPMGEKPKPPAVLLKPKAIRPNNSDSN
jgi:hypothetical protein